MARQMTDKEVTAVQASIAALRASRKASKGMVKVSDQALSFLAEMPLELSHGYFCPRNMADEKMALHREVRDRYVKGMEKGKALHLRAYRNALEASWIESFVSLAKEQGITPEKLSYDLANGDIAEYALSVEASPQDAINALLEYWEHQ